MHLRGKGRWDAGKVGTGAVWIASAFTFASALFGRFQDEKILGLGPSREKYPSLAGGNAYLTLHIILFPNDRGVLSFQELIYFSQELFAAGGDLTQGPR